MPIETDAFDRFKNTDAANRAVLQTIGLACLQVAPPECPVGKYPNTGKVGGNLRRSHTMKIDTVSVKVGVTADYGGYVHNGTSRHKEANPWLRRAVQNNRESIKEASFNAWKGAL